MKKLLLQVAFILCSLTTVMAQQYNDCYRAAEVNDAVFGPITPAANKDKQVIQKHGNGFYFEQGHDITWLSFVVPNDTIMTFDLVPENSSDNIDFLLYKDEDEFCKGIAQKTVKPIRSNMAQPDTANHTGTTGLSAAANDTMVTSGNSQYSKAVAVKKGERYYIVVDNWSTTKGSYILHLYLGFPKYTAPAATESRTKNATAKTTTVKKSKSSSIDASPQKAPPIKNAGKTALHISVVDATNSPVKAQIDVTGYKAGGKTVSIDTTDYDFTLNHGQTININCNAQGYMFTQESYTATDTSAQAELTIRLAKVVENKAVVLKGIEFHEGNAVFLPSSQNSLMNILEFMKSNPTVNIIIKGYVNDPGNGNSGAAKKLSRERAEAVMDFLIAAGINKKRMDYKGYGNSNMLYPNPSTDEEAQANRRVEIEVVK